MVCVCITCNTNFTTVVRGLTLTRTMHQISLDVFICIVLVCSCEYNLELEPDYLLGSTDTTGYIGRIHPLHPSSNSMPQMGAASAQATEIAGHARAKCRSQPEYGSIGRLLVLAVLAYLPKPRDLLQSFKNT